MNRSSAVAHKTSEDYARIMESMQVFNAILETMMPLLLHKLANQSRLSKKISESYRKLIIG